MRDSDRQTRSHLMQLFEARGFHPRHDLGQNFLIDLNLLEFVVTKAEVTRKDVVLEIGTGTGSMTAYLADQAAAVVSVEIDTRVYGVARETLDERRNVTLLNVDALKNKSTFNPDVVAALQKYLADDPERRVKLVANLPYSIATPVISNLVASGIPWRMMVITIQWELAERMQARHGSSHYGALSVFLQAQCYVKTLRRLKPVVFWPRPGVDSAIVRLTPDRNSQNKILDKQAFHEFIRQVFQQRRKVLRTVLAGMYRDVLSREQIDETLANLKIGERARAEELNVRTLVQLCNAVVMRLDPTKSLPVATVANDGDDRDNDHLSEEVLEDGVGDDAFDDDVLNDGAIDGCVDGDDDRPEPDDSLSADGDQPAGSAD